MLSDRVEAAHVPRKAALHRERVRDRARDSAALKPKSLDEAQGNVSAPSMPLDDRYLEDVALHVGHGMPGGVDFRLQDTLLGDQLIGKRADDPNSSAACRNGKVD